MPFANYLKKINALHGVGANFITRIPEVPTSTHKQESLQNLETYHKAAVKKLGFSWSELHRAEQIHGAKIQIVSKNDRAQTWPGVDGLISADAGVLLGIYVADCGALYIVDPVKKVIALLHSGKKGTEQKITTKTLKLMCRKFGSSPSELIVALAPCIRPPRYEVDFATDIARELSDAGVPGSHFIDSAICTGSNLEKYYSYRMERGKTGRMLALLGRN